MFIGNGDLTLLSLVSELASKLKVERGSPDVIIEVDLIDLTVKNTMRPLLKGGRYSDLLPPTLKTKVRLDLSLEFSREDEDCRVELKTDRAEIEERKE